jgi:HEAT repeat protein
LRRLVAQLGRLNSLPVGDRVADALYRIDTDESAALLLVLARRDRFHAALALKAMGETGRRALEKALGDPDPALRTLLPQVYRDAGLNPGDAILGLARNDLHSGNKARQKAGLAGLARLMGDDAHRAEMTALIRPHLDGNDPVLRQAAGSAMLRWAAKEDVATFLNLLDVAGLPGPERKGVIDALGAAKDERAVAALTGLLGGTESSWAEAALVASGGLAEKAVRKHLDTPDVGKRYAAIRVLKGLGVKENLEFDLAWRDANSDRAESRCSGLKLIAHSGLAVPDDKKADLAKLAARLADDLDLGTRQMAIFLLARYATKDQAPLLLRLLEGNAEGLRTHLIGALGRLKEEKAVPLMVKALEENHEREAGVRALRQIGPPAEKAVLGALKSNNTRACLAALRALAVIGGKDSLPALEELAKDGSARDRALAEEARKVMEEIKKRG